MAENDETSPPIRCHYEVLGVPRDADETTIKQAHRRLALKHHPDRPTGDAFLFRQCQDAYECLTDPAERRWYDDHRDVILRGWSVNDNNKGSENDYCVPLTPCMMPSYFQGFDESMDNNFYAAYAELFEQIYQEEELGSSKNDAAVDYLHAPFGTSTSDWTTVVSVFYTAWESFSSTQSFAWADIYDNNPAEEEHRRMRRAKQDANNKARKAARKERTTQVLLLVKWVKRRDPRVVARQQQLKQEQEAKMASIKADRIREKKANKKAMEEWREQSVAESALIEEQDRLAGRVRLADLEDDDYEYAGSKKKKGKKKNKKKWNDAQHQAPKTDETEDEKEDPKEVEKEDEKEDANAEEDNTGKNAEEDEVEIPTNEPQENHKQDDASISSEEEEPDEWRCECCRKDFKSLGQMENHLKSKKHKATFKKYEAILASMEGATI